jgi:hypothetical protein
MVRVEAECDVEHLEAETKVLLVTVVREALSSNAIRRPARGPAW